jgi:membrane protease YdiL (CAAX protease family)
MSAITSATLKVALSAGVVAVVLFRTRKLPREELGLVRPHLGLSAGFIVLYLAWMLASEAAIHWRGPWDLRPWIETPLAAAAMRVLAVSLLGPIAEELVFRGWFFGLLTKRVGTLLTIIATAVGWALLHYTYTWTIILVVLVDGILLGMARWKTRSVYVPIVMHALYNFYAIW